MVGFAIICSARRGRWLGIEYVALSKGRGGEGWWSTTDERSVLLIPTREEAEKRLAEIRFNSPEIVTYERACRIMREQRGAVSHARQEIDKDAAMDDPSWDAHKSW